jgi:hypothetical protein
MNNVAGETHKGSEVKSEEGENTTTAVNRGTSCKTSDTPAGLQMAPTEIKPLVAV